MYELLSTNKPKPHRHDGFMQRNNYLKAHVCMEVVKLSTPSKSPLLSAVFEVQQTQDREVLCRKVMCDTP